MGVPKTSDHIQINIRMQNPSQEPPVSSKAPNQDLNKMDVLCNFKIENLGIAKASDHIQIKIKMPNLSQEPPASSKAPNEDLKDMDVLCTFKLNIESQNLQLDFIKEQWPYPNQD